MKNKVFVFYQKLIFKVVYFVKPYLFYFLSLLTIGRKNIEAENRNEDEIRSEKR